MTGDNPRKERWKQVHASVDRALHGVELPTSDRTKVAGFVNNELPQLQQRGATSYIILGSYRESYGKRLRAMQYELSKPLSATAVVVGDTPDIELDVALPGRDSLGFLLKFHLLGEFADYIVGVYEKEDGGESPELGLINQAPYFSKTYVFPRDYQGLRSETLSTKKEVISAAIQIWFANGDEQDDERDDTEKKIREIRSLLSKAEQNGVSITETEVVNVLEEREDDDVGEEAQYSWVHLSLFRLYEQHGRCYPWRTETELRKKSTSVPGPEPLIW